MSYSVEEYFDEIIVPKLAFLNNDYEKFKDIFKNSDDIKSEKFNREIINVIVNPYGEYDIDEVMMKLFILLYGDKELKKIEYTNGITKINVDYNGNIEVL